MKRCNNRGSKNHTQKLNCKIDIIKDYLQNIKMQTIGYCLFYELNMKSAWKGKLCLKDWFNNDYFHRTGNNYCSKKA